MTPPGLSSSAISPVSTSSKPALFSALSTTLGVHMSGRPSPSCCPPPQKMGKKSRRWINGKRRGQNILWCISKTTKSSDERITYVFRQANKTSSKRKYHVFSTTECPETNAAHHFQRSPALSASELSASYRSCSEQKTFERPRKSPTNVIASFHKHARTTKTSPFRNKNKRRKFHRLLYNIVKSMLYLDLFLDRAMLLVASVVLVRQAPLVTCEHRPGLEDTVDLAVHALSMKRSQGRTIKWRDGGGKLRSFARSLSWEWHCGQLRTYDRL